jgi:hypothetical protein
MKHKTPEWEHDDLDGVGIDAFVHSTCPPREQKTRFGTETIELKSVKRPRQWDIPQHRIPIAPSPARPRSTFFALLYTHHSLQWTHAVPQTHEKVYKKPGAVKSHCSCKRKILVFV